MGLFQIQGPNVWTVILKAGHCQEVTKQASLTSWLPLPARPKTATCPDPLLLLATKPCRRWTQGFLPLPLPPFALT